ncbi:50S ribosomal protein L24 [Candidatus Micrarchaeota archaeon]|nr:50S ribosomal protein L24 [Candidatus Micrarchaeota archaeon]
MAECSFCSREYSGMNGGFTVFERDGTARHFCSRKCRRNQEMKRDARKFKWAKKQGAVAKAARTPKAAK